MRVANHYTVNSIMLSFEGENLKGIKLKLQGRKE